MRGTETICLGGEFLDNLSDMECVPCKGGVPPLSEEESSAFLSQIHDDWEVVENHHLTRTWSFPDFASALEFTNQLGEVCEQQNHHADFELGWGGLFRLSTPTRLTPSLSLTLCWRPSSTPSNGEKDGWRAGSIDFQTHSLQVQARKSS